MDCPVAGEEGQRSKRTESKTKRKKKQDFALGVDAQPEMETVEACGTREGASFHLFCFSIQLMHHALAQRVEVA